MTRNEVLEKFGMDSGYVYRNNKGKKDIDVLKDVNTSIWTYGPFILTLVPVEHEDYTLIDEE
jgi:hypothetical protein